MLVPASPAFSMGAEDYCFFFWFECHYNVITYESADFYWSCPEGCHSYPLDPELLNQIVNAIKHIDNSLCPWAKSYSNYEVFHHNVRYYDTYDGNPADIHLSNGRVANDGQGADYGAQIHVYREYALVDETDLARHMVHEAYHGYFDSDDETAAVANGNFCVH